MKNCSYSIKDHSGFITTNKDIISVNETRKNINKDELFDIEFNGETKNFLLALTIDADMTADKQEIRFIFRSLDKDSYCFFSLKGGREIRFGIFKAAKPIFTTSWIRITDNSLFSEKNNLILSVFESTTTVLVNDTIILNIDETPEVSGKSGISFFSQENSAFNLKIKNLIYSTDPISFEPILDMPKSSSVYFMHANDFYELERFDLSLVYYRKGLLFGKGDHKIYNRMGNLLFMIEEYEQALKYYKIALKEEPQKPEYNINLTRALCRLGKNQEAKEWYNHCIDNNYKDSELFIDYSSVLINENKILEAIALLRGIESTSEGVAPLYYKLGKALITTGETAEGKRYLLAASKIIARKDPSSAAIILKYSLDRIADAESLKFLCSLLREKGDFSSIYELIKQSRVSVELDQELFDYLIESEIETGLTTLADEEFIKYSHLAKSDSSALLRARILIAKSSYEEAAEVLNTLITKIESINININSLVLTAIKNNSSLKKFNNSDKLIPFLNPDKPDYHRALLEYGMLLVDFGDYELGISVFNSIENYFKEEGEFYYNRGLAFMGIEDWLQARNELTLAYRYSQRHPSIAMELATVLFYTNNCHEGIAVLAENYENLPSDGRKENLYANLLMSINKTVEAQKYYYLALENDPENEEYGLNLAESFYKLHDYENAMHIVKQIVTKDKMDRAKTLYYKLKSHLYDTISCSGCTNEWNIPKNSAFTDFNTEMIDKLPENGPAGNCPECGVVYCKKCASKNGKLVCQRCGKPLSFDLQAIKIAAFNILNKTID